MPIEQLSALQATFGSMDVAEMLRAGLAILRFYKELALPLAREHGIIYAEALEGVMVQRLEGLRKRI